MNHLLTNFPYCQAGNRAKQKKTSRSSTLLETNVDPKCVGENLLICYMYCVLNLNRMPVKMKIEMEAITTYISSKSVKNFNLTF